MAIFPNNTAIAGGGSNGAINPLRVIFPNAPLAGLPILEAYTTSTPTPSVVDGPNVDSTFSASDSCVYAIPCHDRTAAELNNWASTLTHVSGSNWGTGFHASGRKLKGTTSTLQLLPSTFSPASIAADSCRFNVAFRTGPLTSTSENANDHVLGMRYIYTGGTDPTVVWQGNSGTEVSPTWTDLVGGDATTPRRIAHANEGADPLNPVITRPESGNNWSKLLVGQAVA